MHIEHLRIMLTLTFKKQSCLNIIVSMSSKAKRKLFAVIEIFVIEGKYIVVSMIIISMIISIVKSLNHPI